MAVILFLVCAFYLSFSVVTSHYDKKAQEYAGDNAAKEYVYLDSIASKKVWFGYTLKECREKEINLGLDLKGGMNVTMEVSVPDIIRVLSGNNTSETFTKAMALAQEKQKSSGTDFVTLFIESFKEVDPNAQLASVFSTFELKDKVNFNSTNDEVEKVIREEVDGAVNNSFKVLRTRIDRFGVVQPNIQKLSQPGRILIELPGVKEPERVRKLLQGSANLEFWETYDLAEILPQLIQINNELAQRNATTEVQKTPAETATQEVKKDTAQNDDLAALMDSLQTDSAELTQEEQLEQYKKQNPLFAVLNPSVNQAWQAYRGPAVGMVHYTDTAAVTAMLNSQIAKQVLPRDLRFAWTVKAIDEAGSVYQLVALKAQRDGRASLEGDVITDARADFSQTSAYANVSMTMNAEGAKAWQRITKENIGKSIAIVLDDMVYSYPNVNGAITGGSSSITGHFTPDEATDLVNVLKSGKLPAPATIIQEQVVGPSLGAKSINAGMISFVIAFLLVLVYMIFFYQGAGVAADIALLCNVLLLFGVLVSFGAVLTLPGIAGLVLTMGMAVDANVIIYERIKEELAAGKGLGKAVADGYKNAYSAIIDGQVTTLLTGIVLFVFGSGPVQGFATTLIIGIITSVLTSIFITRLIFDDRIEKGKSIAFENNLTKNFLKNTHFDFIAARKWSYIISGALIVISVVSIFTKGFTYGVDFTGGRTYVVRFDQPVTAEQVRSAAEVEFDGAVEVKQFGGESQMKITTQYKNDQESTDVDAEVEAKLYNALKPFFAETDITLDEFKSTVDNPNGIISSDKVGPTIANDMKRDAIIAVILSLLVIFAYIAFRFKGWTWGLGGVVSLAHTAIIVIGFFSLFSGILPFNLDVDQTFIAAILTIIGYAINDNVVIFDRIREYRTLHPNVDVRTNTNQAINATLTRTVNTSVSTLVTMLAIAIFGGESIRGLAVALILGICIGTYASIFIGTPVMYDATIWNQKRLAAKNGTATKGSKK